MRLLFFTLLLTAALVSCQDNDDISFKPPKNSGDSQPSGQGGFGSGVPGVDLSVDDPVDYPVTEYAGNGNLKSIEESNPIQVKMRQEISREKLISITERFTSSDSKVNEQVVKLVGQTTYLRVPKTELAERARDPSFRNEPFLMFAKSSVTTNGAGSQSLTYSAPMPFIVIPAEMNTYDSIKSGQFARYSFRASGSGADFDVTSTILYHSVSGDTITIIQNTHIPQDTDGRLYDKLPLPQVLEYTIDTKTKKVTHLRTMTPYHNSKLGKKREVSVDLDLCRYTLKGQSEGTCQY